MITLYEIFLKTSFNLCLTTHKWIPVKVPVNVGERSRTTETVSSVFLEKVMHILKRVILLAALPLLSLWRWANRKLLPASTSSSSKSTETSVPSFLGLEVLPHDLWDDMDLGWNKRRESPERRYGLQVSEQERSSNNDMVVQVLFINRHVRLYVELGWVVFINIITVVSREFRWSSVVGPVPIPHHSTQSTNELFLICVQFFATIVHGDYHLPALVHGYPKLWFELLEESSEPIKSIARTIY